MTWRAVIDTQFATNSVVLRLASASAEKLSVMTDLTFTDVKAHVAPPENGFSLPYEDGVQLLQALMDAAYDFGIRPSRAQDERHLKAHLEDMRTITMHKLGIRQNGKTRQ